MLVVHPTSQCDICLDPYTWSTPAKAPHAIQCGHIFCFDCLRTVNPSNCPMCRKAFNPDRIKKLHVDKAPGEGVASSSRLSEESELMRRVGFLFAEGAEDEDINALVEEVTNWLSRNAGPSHQPLRHAITALHQYKALQRQHANDAQTIEQLRATHERHAHVKQKDLDIAMMVEKNMLEEQEKIRQEYEGKLARVEAELTQLRDQGARAQTEFERYLTSANPLPRPPEIAPLVTNLTREHAAASNHSAQRGVVPLGLGAAPTVGTAAPATQSRSSSGSSRAHAPSVHFADPAPTKEPQTKYRVTTNGEELRQENTRRPHLVVPGAPPSRRVVPPRLMNLDGDTDITPRPSLAPVPAHMVPQGSKVYWPPHLQQYAPKPGSPCVWLGDPDEPHEILPNEVPLESLPQFRPQPVPPSVPAPACTSTVVNAVIPPLPPTLTQTARSAAETGSARMRVAPADAPMSGRSPLAWRPGPAHKEGYVTAYIPEIGITWIPEEQAAKLPVRARGTESRYAYVIAKEPSEVDDEWRRIHDGATPPSNPLQLSGVPEAGPSTSAVQRGQYESIPAGSTAISTLFASTLGASDRTIAASANSSDASLSGLGILAVPASGSRTGRGAYNSAMTANDLGLNIASLPDPRSSSTEQMAEEPEVGPSPALSWGTIPTQSSRNSSLGNLHLNNLPSPHPFARPSESIEQLPIGELNGGPIVLTSAITPRQSSSLFGDSASVSGYSATSYNRDGPLPGLVLNPSAGSSRQVVNSLRDLEDVNRSLLQLANSQASESTRSEPSHSSRPSNRHSRQPSLSTDDPEAMVGPRTGLALYSSRAPTHYSSNHLSNEPSPEDTSPPAQSRPRSGASNRSYAESAYSSHTHQSSHSNHSNHSANSQRPTDHRRRRGSTASALDISNDREHVATWTIPTGMQSYSSSHGPGGSDSRSQKSQDSIPRSVGAMDGLGSCPGSLSSLLLSFDPPSTSSAVTGNGEEATGIHAPRPVNGRRTSMFGGAWNARAGH